MKKNIYSFSIFLGLTLAISLMLPAKAGNYKNYDENIIRAYKMAKIQTLKPNLYVPADATEEIIDKEITNYLLETNYFSKKLKNKPGIFFIECKTDKKTDKSGEITEFIKIDRIYNIKNPEKFMFALNNKLSKKDLANRELIKNNINDDISTYAILFERIEKKNSPLAIKAMSAGYNGFLNIFILTPKMGFGYIINPVFEWIKTDTASDIYKNITSEIEQLSIGEKEALKVKFYKN